MLPIAARLAPRSLQGRRLPPWAVVRTVGIPPWSARAYDEAEWRDALVYLEEGTIELECNRGGRRRFERGAVLWLTGLSLRALHNCGPERVLLVSVSRRHRTSERGPGTAKR